MVISRAVVGKKIFGRQTDGVQALWKRLYPWTDYTWARLYPWTDCIVGEVVGKLYYLFIFFQDLRDPAKRRGEVGNANSYQFLRTKPLILPPSNLFLLFTMTTSSVDNGSLLYYCTYFVGACCAYLFAWRQQWKRRIDAQRWVDAAAAHNSSRLIDTAAAACSECVRRPAQPRVLFFLAAFAWCLC